MKKIAVLNNKGGVGKSTVSVQLAHGLAKLDFKVLLIDLDGQNDSSLFLGKNENDYNKTFYDLIDRRNPAKIEDCIINAREGLDLLPNKHIEEINAEFHREARIDLYLSEKLKGLENLKYDYILIDCGPQRTKINDAVLCYVDHIVMPVQVEAASVRAIGNIYEYLSDLRLSPDMIALVIPNMFDQRTRDSKENLDFLKEFFSDRDIVTDPIHRRVKITEAGKLGKTVFEYDEEAASQFFKVLERLVKVIA
ncbi:ParA family protein [Clostridium estertheticum]|uniref:ParA family protein n=1 Tax=Clostridium estertheticum TaxID=238834 RepID=A0A5N7J849_9CLOT|nr:ParA family protein [Clostridium estertheticum]MBX4271968.1 ParA family protein [Clostridium estertheticum]MPQ34096.1 ParA family protein [Clostridium estertheticum]MPQ64897.1 ParA family protein [Clostridium estertheticum]WLC82060.1 ParA family protein [Clostridium estertheticum]